MSARLPWLVLFAVAALLCCALLWPLPLHLNDWHVLDAFSGSHAWSADHLFQVAFGERALNPTSAAGYPYLRYGPMIGWGDVIASWPLRPWLGPLGSFQLIHLLSLPASALAAALLLRRWTAADNWTIAGAALAYAFCPYLLSTLAIGETPKLQAWGFPLFLWTAQRWMDGARWAGPALALVALGLSFTSPYYGLALPLVIGAFCLMELLRRRRDGPRAWLWVLAPLALTALALIPVYLYFEMPNLPVQARLMRPAAAGLNGALLPSPHPVAALEDLFLGTPPGARSPYEVFHVSYLGLPLLIGLTSIFALTRGGGRGRWAGLALLVGGALLAMGPNLAVGGRFTPLPLPATLLGPVGYPYFKGGMWFRLVILAALGLSVLLASGASKLKHGAWVAWALAALHLADGLRATGPWPLTVEPVPGAAVLQAMRGDDPSDGAVLHFPLQEGPGMAEGQKMLVAAALHGRPTTGLARDLVAVEASAMRAMTAAALDAPDPAAALRALGFRWVVFQPMPPLRSRVSRDELLRKLGEGQGGAAFTAWDLGPTTLAPQATLPGQMGPGAQRPAEGVGAPPPEGAPPSAPPGAPPSAPPPGDLP